MQYKVLIAEFPYGNTTHSDTAEWVCETIAKMHADPRIGKAGTFRWRIADTPITMGRNRCLALAEQHGIDFVLMVDSDMKPDLYTVPGGEPKRPGATPFWDTAWEFALAHDGPCAIAAPYCGPPPHENVYIFRWANYRSNNPNPDFRIDQYSRFEAAGLTGIHRVAALPTGVFLLDMRAVKDMPHPRFYYEYTDARETHKASTEDVTFTRDLAWPKPKGQGVPIYVAFSSWAGHHKSLCVEQPSFVRPEDVAQSVAEGVRFFRRGDAADSPSIAAADTVAEKPIPDAITARNVLPLRGDAMIPARGAAEAV